MSSIINANHSIQLIHIIIFSLHRTIQTKRPLISLDVYNKLILNLLENKHQRTPKGQSKMDNLEKLTKQKHNATCIGHHQRK
jgi:hypothetical protein